MRNRIFSAGLFIISFLIVAFGQPSWIPWLAPLAATIGYALFWKVLVGIESKFKRFCIASLWFTFVQCIQLSWMTSIDFQGVYILFAYFWLATWLGVQFGLLSLFIPLEGPIKTSRIFAIAASWALFEWARFYFLCGFSWSPSGLALTSSLLSLQLASVGGVLGLSFWVMLTNGFAYNLLDLLFRRELPSFKKSSAFALVALLPYLFGICHLGYHDRHLALNPPSKEVTVALIQTGLLPPEKLVLQEHLHHFISPWDQWKRILHFLKSVESSDLDLIVFPEVAVPFHADKAIYPHEIVVKFLVEGLGERVLEVLPPLHTPFAEKKFAGGQERWMVSNSYWTQALANYFTAEVVIGLEDEDRQAKKSYNAAFYFVPYGTSSQRYEKQVLLPMAEYLPCRGFLPFVETYGIKDFFTKGTETKIYNGYVPLAISICYEETFPDLIRQARYKGAEILVNVTNDNWYPSSKLPQQHFDLGRLRAVENGFPLFRSCNTGVSAAIDALGRVACKMHELDDNGEYLAGPMVVTLPVNHHQTIYTKCGDGGVVGLSLILLASFFKFRKRR